MTDELLDQYETYLRSWNASVPTIKARRTLAKSRLRAWGAEGFTRPNIEGFLAADAKGNPRQKWTQATYYNHLTDFCSFLVAAGVLTESPMEAIRKTKPVKRRPNPLTPTEVERLRATLEGEVRDWVQIGLLSGLRAFEIAKLRGEDFTPEGIVVVGKGDKEAVLPCHPEIQEMRERYPSHGYWFPGPEDGHISGQRVSMIVGKVFHAMGISGSMHRTRHYFATDLLRQGVNIRVVQRLMRHESLDTTAGYLAVLGVEEAEAILKLSA